MILSITIQLGGLISYNYYSSVDNQQGSVMAQTNVRQTETSVSEEDYLDDNDLFTELPVILVEALSRSTRRVDETTKRVAYLQIPSLQKYVLIEQDFVDVEVVRRRDGWQSKHYFMGDEITFESIELTLTVEEIYDRVKNTDMTG